MKSIISILILNLMLIGNNSACVNTYGLELKTGFQVFEEYNLNSGNIRLPHHNILINNELYPRKIIEFDSLYKNTNDIEYLTDKGVLLIYSKRYSEAIKLYLEIEKIKPNLYSTASNIGTAYELIGENKLALKWIKKAIKINPKSHLSSEWIHLNILKTKASLNNHHTDISLINTSFGLDSIPYSSLKRDELIHLYDQINFQLTERMTFIKPKDLVIGQLLFELGNIAYILNWYSLSNYNYNLANKYGLMTPIIYQRLNLKNVKQINQKTSTPISKSKKQESKYSNIIILSIGIFILVLIILAYFKKKKLF